MTGHTIRTVVVGVLGSIGLAASLSGAVGIIRMPDLYTRIQAATKNVTMGALPMLAAVVIATGPVTQYGSRALILAVLLLVASPMSSYALGRAAYHIGIPMWSGAVIDQPAEEAARQRGASGPDEKDGTDGSDQARPR